MSQVQLYQRTNRVEVSRQPIRPAPTGSSQTASYRCLIASNNAPHVSMFSRAATEQGWEPVICHDAKTAAREAICQQIQMAVIDVAQNGTVPDNQFREIAERLVSEKNALVMICGSEDNPEEEIWARQIGAWLYLPGVDEETDIAMLCGESKNIVEKLRSMSTDINKETAPDRKPARNLPR
ncbi:MAG: hypothetical protein JW829_01560 [Pirellulales bacterium]|nr:hypothetical protein [Pirellulales bacterium]